MRPPRVVKYSRHPHEGDPKRTLLSAINGFDLKAFDRIVATGRKFRSFVNLTSIPEPEAVEYAYRFVKPPGVSCPAVVSAGGETFMVYVLNRLGQISNVLTGNKCASGTGEFFLQQLAENGRVFGRGRPVGRCRDRAASCFRPLLGFLQIRLYPRHQ